jgi:hypothetical protein
MCCFCASEHHQTRDDDVRDALAALDAAGTASRRKGRSKRRKGGEHITPGPDWLWCCDRDDKFRNFGIEIYAGVDALFKADSVVLSSKNDP